MDAPESARPASTAKRIRVCVLCSSYEGSESELKEFDDLKQTPQWYFAEDDPQISFDTIMVKKATSYRTIRALVKTGNYDVFYNQCDGARDEDRAGEDVIRALEEFKVPFTASLAHCYELPKPEMKMVAHYANIPTAPSAVVERSEDVERRCASLRFPVIVKHVCGYSSIGMTKDCKCETMEQLHNRVERFIKDYQSALVEEFVAGDEVTVLACGDSSFPDGIRVFPPVQVRFPPGDDFKHFDLKWQAFDDMGWHLVDAADPALPQMVEITRVAFREVMGGVGYGRVDLRVNRATNRVVFLEINPNCGIMYPPGQESSADWILKLTPNFGHKEFVHLQIREAIARCDRQRPKFSIDFDARRGYHVRASTKIPRGVVVFEDEGRPFRVVSKVYVEKHWSPTEQNVFRQNAWPLGSDQHLYALWDGSPQNWRPINHSCDPNVGFDEQKMLNYIALRDIDVGEELTCDYRTMVDDIMDPFQCFCGASCCIGVVQPKQPWYTPIREKRFDTDPVRITATTATTETSNGAERSTASFLGSR